MAGLVCDIKGFHALAAPVGNAVVAHVRAFAVAFLRNHQQLGIVAVEADHAHHLVGFGERNAAHTRRRAAHGPHPRLVEADGHAGTCRNHDFIGAVGQRHIQQAVALVDGDGIDSRLARPRVGFQRGFLDGSVAGTHHQVVVVDVVRVAEGFDVDHRPHLVARFNLDQVLERPAFGGLATFGYFVHLQPKNLAAFRENHHVVVVGGHEQVFRKVGFLGGHAARTDPTPALRAVLIR